MFSANQVPTTSDSSSAFFDRWLVLNFERKFRGVRGLEVPSHILDARLADPRELSGLLNKALDALPGLLEHGFTETDSMKEAKRQFRMATCPILCWLEENVLEGATMMVPKRDLLDRYNRDAARDGRPAATKKAFGLAVKEWKPRVEDGKRTWLGSDRVEVWLGLGLRAPRQPGEEG